MYADMCAQHSGSRLSVQKRLNQAAQWESFAAAFPSGSHCPGQSILWEESPKYSVFLQCSQHRSWSQHCDHDRARWLWLHSVRDLIGLSSEAATSGSHRGFCSQEHAVCKFSFLMCHTTNHRNSEVTSMKLFSSPFSISIQWQEHLGPRLARSNKGSCPWGQDGLDRLFGGRRNREIKSPRFLWIPAAR